MKLKLFFFALLASFFSMTAYAYALEIDGIYYNFSETEATVTGNSRNSTAYQGSVVIPSSVNGTTYSVTSIENEAFLGCSGLTNVYCHAEQVPSAEIDAYKAKKPWSEFKAVAALTEINDVVDNEIEWVEYLSNSEGCVINTDVYPTQDTKFEIKMDFGTNPDFWM